MEAVATLWASVCFPLKWDNNRSFVMCMQSSALHCITEGPLGGSSTFFTLGYNIYWSWRRTAQTVGG